MSASSLESRRRGCVRHFFAVEGCLEDMVKKVAFGCFFLGESSSEGYTSFLCRRVLLGKHGEKGGIRVFLPWRVFYGGV